jgi:hypothetical protein
MGYMVLMSPRNDDDAGQTAFDDDFSEADAGDFAGEHDETDLADDPAGGPEHAEEEETPRGHAGMD